MAPVQVQIEQNFQLAVPTPEEISTVLDWTINSTKKRNKKQRNIIIEFTNVSLEQNRALVEMLYCDMTWWKNAKRPSGVDVFIEMMSSLFGLRSLMTKY